jgi:hypothetical protein
MAKILPRIYWDACCWIAYIQREMPQSGGTFTEKRFELCSQTLKRAVDGDIEIATSSYTLAEVCKRPTLATEPLPIQLTQVA